MNDSKSSEKSGEKTDKTHGKNAVEWIVFGLSCALVSAMLGYLAYLSLTMQESAPQLRATLGQSVERDGQIWVPVVVENRGSMTANNVEIEVEGENGKSAGFTLPHVPRNGTRQGWVGFEPPLQTAKLKARISGYQMP